jgi:hypothetical protein
VTFDIDQRGPPLRAFPAHRMAALLSGLGVVVVQWGWLEMVRPDHAERWPAIACLLVVATGYLVCLTWFHASCARRRANMPAQRRWRLGRGLAYDLTICGLMVVTLVRGHESGLLRLGLWMIPPTLLTTSAVSAAVTLLAWLDGNHRFSVDLPPPSTSAWAPRHDWARSLSWLVLAVVLLIFEFSSAQPASG